MAELSVEYNPYFHEWLMIYSCAAKGVELRTAPQPWGPWSAPQLIFNPAPNAVAHTGYCYFIHWAGPGKCRAGANPPGNGRQGAHYAAYFVAGWTTGLYASPFQRAESTFYYTLSTLNPYGEVILKSTIEGPVATRTPPTPTCKQGHACK
jgi:hypothetical protein